MKLKVSDPASSLSELSMETHKHPWSTSSPAGAPSFLELAFSVLPDPVSSQLGTIFVVSRCWKLYWESVLRKK